MVAPVGTSNINDVIKPIIKAITDIIMLDITTFLKDLKTCIDDKVGNIIRLDISKAPIRRIPSTTTIEHNEANIILYIFVLIPIDFANTSSKVIANILL